MKSKITEKTFYKYIKCPAWIYFDVHEEKKAIDPIIDKLVDDKMLSEKEKELIKEKKLVEVKSEDLDEAFNETLVYMREGEQTIYGAVLIDDNYVGHPDLLERVEGTSELGEYYYIACDFKRCHDVRNVYKFQGCFYAEILQRIQGIKPVQGYVMNQEGDVMEYSIEEFEDRFNLVLEDIENIIKGARPPAFLTSGCKQSPWTHKCQEQAEACDDLSLLNRIWRKEKEELNSKGVGTIPQLARANINVLTKRITGVTRSRLEWMQQQAIALTEDQYFVMEHIVFPEANEEIYFDIESDPLRDVDYLFGVFIVKNGKGKYHKFLAHEIDGEAEAWGEFTKFIAKHPKAPIYHYGSYEQFEVEKMYERYSASDKAINALRENMFDMLPVIRESVIFPLYHYSLKDLARYVGFDWRDADASGVNSVLWYHQWVDLGDIKKMERIVDYNEDDCVATWKLKEWLDNNA